MIIIKKNNRTVDRLARPKNCELSQSLLRDVHCLLRKNKISLDQVLKAIFQSDLPDNFTSRRIIHVVSDIFTFGLNTAHRQKNKKW